MMLVSHIEFGISNLESGILQCIMDSFRFNHVIRSLSHTILTYQHIHMYQLSTCLNILYPNALIHIFRMDWICLRRGGAEKCEI